MGVRQHACVIYNAGNVRIVADMNLIARVIEPDADGTLHLPLPKAWQNQSIRVRAELEPVGVEKEPGRGGALENLKGFGCLHGKISLAPDFDEPLEDFKDYMA